jgi:hypothetical protein
MLRHYVAEDQCDWDEHLEAVEFAVPQFLASKCAGNALCTELWAVPIVTMGHWAPSPHTGEYAC